ncbi:bifunctional [glutamate--ammonia ligase]-adenylyl-L-tyrosine phosphorylase/[glutamate--ammonia-ligase] adenylyltransferase [Halochromatium salexigens]|uniref:Bifunctional glutamine synthetase adenylyltransferase/adenylyl-removing enzyme n=1 Tax=Halochromatium salexigens TaxID=49447 RepID=A0AAJ0UID1_HALSE|nr:bifunctional [glutamate--ammonia ligase]-adenylyl-L-tyrosine phosphorylase/[glutamate--ammonia-ligase] adenylyltransferase [Halochromatium salexigens]MBK5932034.1 bifunctional glutamine synthetase adenylyltransferase/deadenyltransferase [Halochromatium salexigens]
MQEIQESANDSHWQQWCDWALEQGLEVPRDQAFTAARARVWEGSEFVALTAARHPHSLAELLESGALRRASSAEQMSERLRAALAEVADEAQLQQILRHFRRQQMLRIVFRDLAGWAALDETLEDLTALADSCIRESLRLLEPWTRAELGMPEDGHGRPQSLLVLGMGKLGARELNLSSDIDLIFAFPSAGRVAEGPRELSVEQFFGRLCQRLVKALNAKTVDGFVFRVDTRLRPFGDAGPLAMSFDAMEGYYHSQAREWERYAMTKARVVAGPPEDQADLEAMLRPFVYRRYLDFGAIASLRHLKGLIDRELRRKGMADNIKLGPGGIREIEFIGQSFQLIRGGREPELQVRPIQQVLALLGDKGLLEPDTVTELSAAYRFLRLTENRLQAWRDEQTHSLPSAAPARERLARSMGYAEWDAFAADLDAHRARVQRHFDEVFADPDEPPRTATSVACLWERAPEQAEALTLLEAAGFEEAESAWRAILDFHETADRRGLSNRGLARLGLVMPRLLEEVAACGAPDLTLGRVLKVLEAVLGRTAYLDLLAEHPDALHQLVRLSAKSPWFGERTARQPLLLDELLDPRRLFEPLHRAALEQELDQLLSGVEASDLEQRMERLRQFAEGNRLRVAAADVTGAIPLMVVSDYLTEIAEVTTARSLEIAWHDLVERHGSPPGTDRTAPGFSVIGYGKVGGIELGYNSDLDLVFVYDEACAGTMTEGPRPVASEQFYVRLGQRLIHVMTTPTYSGVLYEVDMRLRPDGNKGRIARSLASFADYQVESAWTWEHQALVRARPIAGDPRLGERFGRVRAEILQRAREPEPLREEVRSMRAKMRANLDKTRAGWFDLKQGAGGIADIEFMVQYAVLRWAREHPDLTRWTDNIRLLETLIRLGLLADAVGADLTSAYKALRAAYHRRALQDTAGLVEEARLGLERAAVIAIWHQLMAS